MTHTLLIHIMICRYNILWITSTGAMLSIQHCTILSLLSCSVGAFTKTKVSPNLPGIGQMGTHENLSQLSVMEEESRFHRRLFLSHSSILIASLLSINEADAAQGAAEYDAEYYVRNLFNGNRGKPAQSIRAGPPIRDARTMKVPAFLLDETCSAQCIVGNELSRYSDKSATVISQLVDNYREKSSRAFQVKSPWKEKVMNDQYYFDLSCYAVWRAAAELIPNLVQRDNFARSIGRSFLSEIKKHDIRSVHNSGNGSTKPTDTLAKVYDVLKYFESIAFIDSFFLGERNKESIRSESDKTNNSMFDEFDDDDFMSGLSVNALLSVIRPATLGASLQITGEGSRFAPDFIGCTLAALWEESGYDVSYESYFVDNEYRPNPKDFFPDEQLFQFTLTPSRQ